MDVSRRNIPTLTSACKFRSSRLQVVSSPLYPYPAGIHNSVAAKLEQFPVTVEEGQPQRHLPTKENGSRNIHATASGTCTENQVSTLIQIVSRKRYPILHPASYFAIAIFQLWHRPRTRRSLPAKEPRLDSVSERTGELLWQTRLQRVAPGERSLHPARSEKGKPAPAPAGHH